VDTVGEIGFRSIDGSFYLYNDVGELCGVDIKFSGGSLRFRSGEEMSFCVDVVLSPDPSMIVI
jgi:hypothetical protein